MLILFGICVTQQWLHHLVTLPVAPNKLYSWYSYMSCGVFAEVDSYQRNNVLVKRWWIESGYL